MPYSSVLRWHHKVVLFALSMIFTWSILGEKPGGAWAATVQAKAVTFPYRVSAGDQLWYLASRFSTSVEAIKFANSLKSDMIYAGQILIIPAGQPNYPYNSGMPYKVTYGDQLWYLAKVYGTTVDAIIQANRLASDQIFANQVIFIPVATGSTAKATAPTTTQAKPAAPPSQTTARPAVPAAAAPAAPAAQPPAPPAPPSPTIVSTPANAEPAGGPAPVTAPAASPIPATAPEGTGSNGSQAPSPPGAGESRQPSPPAPAQGMPQMTNGTATPPTLSITAGDAAMRTAQVALAQWAPDVAVTMVAIAGAESGWNPAAAGDSPSQLTGGAQVLAMGYNCPLGSPEGAASFGLWQVFMPAHLNLLQLLGAPVNNPCGTAAWLTDPANNAKAARAIWDEQGFTAWTMYNNGMYRYFIDEAARAVSAVRQLLGI